MLPLMSSLLNFKPLKFKPFAKTPHEPTATWLTKRASEGEIVFMRDWLALSVQEQDTKSDDTDRQDGGQRRGFVSTQPPNQTQMMRPTDLKKEPMKLSL